MMLPFGSGFGYQNRGMVPIVLILKKKQRDKIQIVAGESRSSLRLLRLLCPP
jgi:hypothetical protein